MDYYVEIDGRLRNVSKEEYQALNDTYSKRYKTTTDEAEKRLLIARLYALNKPLFRSWQIWDADSREDYEQESFLFLHKALGKYEPGRGAFVPYLQWYAGKQRRATFRAAEREQAIELTPEPPDSPAPEEEPDPLLWRAVRKRLSPRDYENFSAIIQEDKMIQDVAAKDGRCTKTIAYKFQASLDSIKSMDHTKSHHITSNHITSPKISEKSLGMLGEGISYLTLPDLAREMTWSLDYARKAANPRIARRYCSILINPAHIVGRGKNRRFMFKTTERGHLLPGLMRRPDRPRPKIGG